MSRTHPERILMVTSLLGGGGAERILLTMAEWWSRARRRVTVLVLRADNPGAEYFIPPEIIVKRLGLIAETNPIRDPRHLLSLAKLRTAIHDEAPDVVISFVDKLNVAVLLAATGMKVPVVATEHLAPWHNPLGFSWELMRRLVYRKARLVVSPTARITEYLDQRMSGRFITLPSPADLGRFGKRSEKRPRRPVIAAMGRLVFQKGFDLLLQAAAPVLHRYPDWGIEIAGTGSELYTIQAHIREKGLEGQVRLLGRVAAVEDWLLSCEVFVLSSRHEAYPMVMCEAMAAGCAIVAFDCATGPREILGHPPCGYLVPAEDVGGLGSALLDLLTLPNERARFGRLAVEHSSHLDANVIMPFWDKAISEACA